jgi:hypothetical protein
LFRRKKKVASEGNEAHGFEIAILKSLNEDPEERRQRMDQHALDRELEREQKKARFELETKSIIQHAQREVSMENMMMMMLKQFQRNNKEGDE